MAKDLVLVTGVNGFIAAQTAAYVLSQGYPVRGTVRRLESAKPLLEGPLSKYASTGKFSIVQVQDITVDGCFDEAVKDVTAILHIAAPVSLSFTDPEPVLHGAINGTLGLLKSALKAGPQLKTVVLASSIAAVRNKVNPPYTFTEKDFNNWSEDEVAKLGKASPSLVIYYASKSAAERVFWEFKREENPKFTMTSVNPVFVIGPPLIPPKKASEVGETISQIWEIFSGAAHPDSKAMSPYVVDVRDVAKVFLYPIVHPQETDNERYIASGAASHPQAYADILRDAFPDAKGRIIEGTRGAGYRSDYTLGEDEVRVDGGKAGKIIGGYTNLMKSVIDTAKTFEGLV